jgi:hypothetical protein
MSLLTIDELTTAPTSDELFDSMIAWLVSIEIPADKWRTGGVARSILRVVANTFATFATLIALFASGAYLDTATGDWLTLLARNVYGVERIQGQFATGSVLASNAGGSIYTFAAGDFIVLNAVSGAAYINTGAFTLNPGDLNIAVPVIATVLGTGSNANPGDVTGLGVALTGVTVTNPDSIVGQNEQSDADLRSLCLAKLGALSMAGPRGAYAYAIASALNAGSPVNVNRHSISPSSSTGVVTIYVASPAGVASSGDVAAIQANVEAVARPDSVTANVSSVAITPYTATLDVWARATKGLDAPTLSTLVGNVLTAQVAAYDIGGVPKPPSTQGYLYAETIEAWAQSAHPSIYSVDCSGGDLALSPGHVATLGVTINIHLVTVASTS